MVGIAVSAVGTPKTALGGACHKSRLGFFVREPGLNHAVQGLLAHPKARRSSTSTQDAGVLYICSRISHRTKKAAECNRSSSLNVVVEHAIIVTIPLQEGHSLQGFEVFKLNHAVRPP